LSNWIVTVGMSNGCLITSLICGNYVWKAVGNYSNIAIMTRYEHS